MLYTLENTACINNNMERNSFYKLLFLFFKYGGNEENIASMKRFSNKAVLNFLLEGSR